ncbi:nuclear transport factor 2 family protein [Halomonas sp. DX6]|uniref:Nuclear transport factor 2 family protein n=1 Tax=Billgrantia bachuensis TaxID=2717286 RepID=A0ABX0PT33_9GAMM|nr:nuclear transport factor 2 family protein [Halomonas bachuensis]
MEIEAILIEQVKALLTSEVRSSATRLQALLAPDFLEIGASGDFFGIDSVLDRLPQETDW